MEAHSAAEGEAEQEKALEHSCEQAYELPQPRRDGFAKSFLDGPQCLLQYCKRKELEVPDLAKTSQYQEDK